MTESVRELLSLATPQARLNWLQKHAPNRDEALVAALRDEAYRRERDNPHHALEIAQILSEAADLWQDEITRAVSLHVSANAHHLLGQHNTALQRYQQAATIYYNAGSELDAARVAVGHLATLKDLGRYEEALAIGRQAGQVFRSAGDQLALGKLIMNQGNLYARLDRYQDARQSYVEARQLFTALNDQRYLAILDTNEANILVNLDDFPAAERLFKRAQAHFKAENMSNLVAQIDDNLAYFYHAIGDYQRALAAFNRARRIFAVQQDPVNAAYADLHRSDTYLALNLWQEALNLARDARHIFEQANRPWETARLWLNEAAALGHIYPQETPDEALTMARRVFNGEENQIWLAVTDLYQANFDWRHGKHQQAAIYATQARQTFAQADLGSRTAQCDIILGEIALSQNDLQDAVAHFEQGLADLDQADLPTITFACQYGLGRAARQQGRFEEARNHFRYAVAAIERLQATIGAEDYKMAFLSDKLNVYEDLVVLCLTLGTPEAQQEAFETVEQAKSRSLLEALDRQTAATAASPAEASLLVEMRQLRNELSWYYNRLYQPETEQLDRPWNPADLTSAISQREQKLENLLNQWRSPDLATTPQNPVWIVTAAHLQGMLSPETMVLEFFTTTDSVIAFGLSSATMWVEILPTSPTEIANYLGQLRFQMNKFGYGPAYREQHTLLLLQSVNDTLLQLYQNLLEPIIDRLTTERLLIIPHQILHYAPFHAFFDGQRHLIDYKTVSYAPSATILYRLLQKKPPLASAPPLLMGLPDAALPNIGTEVENIAALFPHTQIRLGDQATRQQLTSESRLPAFLHLASHAIFRADNPLFSALKLADGWFSVNDIYGLPHVPALITLSACETGRSQVVVGDELVGLCRGFFSTGAHSLVVSLWAVEDGSTAQLMADFYRHLQQGRPVGLALRQAQLSIKAHYPHPYHWAGFILTGSPRLIIRSSP